MSTTCPSRPACCTSISACRRTRARADRRASTSTPVRAAPGVVGVLTGRRHPGRERRQPGPPPRRAAARDRLGRVRRPADLRRRRHDPRAGAARGAAREGRVRGPAGDPRRRGARRPTRRAGDRSADPDARRRRGRASPPRRAASQGRLRDRRAGAFLPRRPDRARHPGRGRRRHGPFLDPAPDRDPAHGRRRCSACRSHAVTVEMRRMGGGFGGKETPGQPVRLRRARSSAQKTGRAGQDAGPTATTTWSITGKRHDFLVDYEVGFDDDGPDPRRRHAPSPRAAATRPTSPGRSPTARCSTPTTATIYPACRAALAAAARPTPSRTPPFAASAGRRA